MLELPSQLSDLLERGMDSLSSGALIAGRYRLSAPLGRGNQGSVWEAVDTKAQGRICAVKFNLWADPSLDALGTEAEVLLALEHRSLPRVLDLGQHDGRRFLVLERIVGVPLDQLKDPVQITRALFDVAGALSCIHDAGLIHGDVKPANILVASDRTYLVDFGLSFHHAREDKTLSGTLAFVAPEVLVGVRGFRADLYALGVSGFLAYTKHHPLGPDPSDRMMILTAIAQRRHPDPTLAARLPAFVSQPILALLEPDPERRPLSARVWLGHLVRHASDWLDTARRRSLANMGNKPLHPPTQLPPLVGRTDERQMIAAAITDALAGNSVGVIVVGPVGSGRSRVLDDAIRDVQIARVAQGEMIELLDSLPESPLRPTLIRRDDCGTEEATTLARSVINMRELAGWKSPLVLALTTEPVPSVGAGLTVVSLGPLAPDAFRQLAEHLTGGPVDPEVLDALLSASSGLPGRLVDLVRNLGPSSGSLRSRDEIEAAAATHHHGTRVVGQLEPFDSTELDLVLTLLAARDWVPIAVLASQFGSRTSQVLQRLAERVVVTQRDRAVRVAIAVDIDAQPSAIRARAAILLDRLVRLSPEAPDAWRAQVAWLSNDLTAALTLAEQCARAPDLSSHARIGWYTRCLLAGGDRPTYAVSIADERIALGQSQAAIESLDGLPATAPVLLRRAEALRRGGRTREAQALAEPLTTSLDAEEAAIGRLVLARIAMDQGDRSHARQWLTGISTELPGWIRVREGEVRALLEILDGNSARADELVRRVIHEPTARDDPRQRARLLSLRGMAAQQRNDAQTAVHSYTEAWQIASRSGDLHGAATYAVNIGTAAMSRGVLGEALEWFQRGSITLARLGRLSELARSLANLAALHAFIGDGASALEYASRAVKAAVGSTDPVCVLVAEITRTAQMRHGTDRAETLAQLASQARELGQHDLANETLSRAVTVFARAGDVANARSHLRGLAEVEGRAVRSAELEVALACAASPPAIRAAMDRLTTAVAGNSTVEHEVEMLELVYRAHMALQSAGASDAEGLLRAQTDLNARIHAMASTLPEVLASAFIAHHARIAPVVFERKTVPGRRSDDAARWRRLAEIAREINAEHALRPLLERIMDAIVELSGASRGFLLLAGLDGTLRVRTARNVGRTEIASAEASPSRSIAERVASTGEPVITIDATGDERFSAFDSVSAFRVRSVLAVPLRAQGAVVGTVYVDDRFRAGAFGDDALEVAREFAEVAGVAIHNARMSARLRRSLRQAERLTRQLKLQVESQSVQLDATRRALSITETTRGRYDDIIGRSPRMVQMLTIVDKVAPTSMSVLVLGESGTGKELVARAIHQNSPRAARPFVAENCSAIPETLLESVLFGHVRGAFTGADRARAGLFEVADGGTLFLDEIGEMSAAMQSRLLRVLQEGEVRPLGGEKVKKVDVRVIAATHRNLEQMVKEGQFRQDLYFRLAVVNVNVPPLRERREDIPEMLEKFVQRAGYPQIRFDRSALQVLVAHPWPGNVRQLQNVVLRSCVMADGVVYEKDLPPELLSSMLTSAPADDPSTSTDIHDAVDQLERRLLLRALRGHQGNQTHAAKALGLSRFGLQKKLRRLGINVKETRGGN